MLRFIGVTVTLGALFLMSFLSAVPVHAASMHPNITCGDLIGSDTGSYADAQSGLVEQTELYETQNYVAGRGCVPSGNFYAEAEVFPDLIGSGVAPGKTLTAYFWLNGAEIDHRSVSTTSLTYDVVKTSTHTIPVGKCANSEVGFNGFGELGNQFHAVHGGNTCIYG